MPDRPAELAVWLDTEPVADISEHRGRLRLRYRDHVVDTHAGQPFLSCSLPVRNRWLDATNFFDGVLPEGQFRAVLAARAGVAANDIFGLLSRYGRDLAGALVIADADQAPRTPAVQTLDHSALEDEVAALPDQPLGIHDDSELSIAGLQNKLLLVRLPDGGWGRPINGAPSTHILKLDSQAHPGVVAAEAGAMRLALATGLTTVEVELHTISGIDCLIVERFDRRQTDNGTSRLHQEDICQALDLPAARKYELPGRGADRGGGGPEFSQVADLLDRYATDQVAELQRLAKVAAFTAIIGNADAHGKNLALLHPQPGTVTLAPLYDTVPTVLFPRLKDQAAMTIGAATNLATVTNQTIHAEAKRWHIDPALATQAATELATDILDNLDALDTIGTDTSLRALVKDRAEQFLSPAA